MIDYSGARTSPYAFFYIWLALYALFFFAAGQAVLQVLFIAIAYAAVVVGDVTSGGQDGLVAIGEAAPRWIMTVGTLVVAVALVGMLKERWTAWSSASRTPPGRIRSPACATGVGSTRPSSWRWSGRVAATVP